MSTKTKRAKSLFEMFLHHGGMDPTSSSLDNRWSTAISRVRRKLQCTYQEALAAMRASSPEAAMGGAYNSLGGGAYYPFHIGGADSLDMDQLRVLLSNDLINNARIRGSPVSVSETHSAPTFPWYADVDMKLSREFQVQEGIDFGRRVILPSLRMCFQNTFRDDGSCPGWVVHVCMAATKTGSHQYKTESKHTGYYVCTMCGSRGQSVFCEVCKEGECEHVDVYKTGIHYKCHCIGEDIGVPGPFVQHDSALGIYSAATSLAKKQYPDLLPSLDDWGDIIDPAVYSGGARVVGCGKIGKCPSCSSAGTASPTCIWCHGTRKAFDTRRYIVVASLLVSTGCEVSGPPAGIDTLRATSVRAPKDTCVTPGYLLPPNIPQYCGPARGPRASTDDVQYNLAPHLAQGTNHAHTSVRNGRKAGKKNSKTLVTSVVTLDAVHRILDAIRTEVTEWRDLVVGKVWSANPTKSTAALWVNVDGCGSNYCTNRGARAGSIGFHTSARIWFEITKRGVRQRCHGSKQGKYGTCKLFATKTPYVAHLTSSLTPLLFPSMPSCPKGKGNTHVGPSFADLCVEQVPAVGTKRTPRRLARKRRRGKNSRPSVQEWAPTQGKWIPTPPANKKKRVGMLSHKNDPMFDDMLQEARIAYAIHAGRHTTT